MSNLSSIARCALKAYRREGDRIKLHTKDIDLFTSDDELVEGFVASDEERVIVAFAGTNEIGDWMTNAQTCFQRVVLSEGREVKIHEGFYNGYLKVQNQVQDLVTKHRKGTTKKLYFTGHSLGGAFATIATLMVDSQGLEVKTIVFGCPKVGGWSLRSPLKDIVVRIEARGDVVPRLPRSWMNLRRGLYHPVGRVIRRGFWMCGFGRAHSMDRYHEIVKDIERVHNLVY